MRIPLSVTLFVLAAVPPAGAAPQAAGSTPVAPEIVDARNFLRAGEWSEAIRVLEDALAEDDSNPVAWLLLGKALGGSGRWEDAVDVFALAADLEAVAGRAHFETARLYAGRSRTEDALAHIEVALEKGFQARFELLFGADFEGLRSSERFLELVPPLEPSAECFVEDVRVLHTFYGEAPGDVFGWIGRDLGDVDGDGKSDVLISAPYNTEGGAAAGKIYVYSGVSGELLFAHAGTAGEQLGLGIEAAGDVNGDGFMDAAAGAPNTGPNPGHAYVYGGAGGELLLTLTAGNGADSFGRKLSGGVDFDGDGCDDLLVGAPGAGVDGKSPGHAYLFSGKSGELLATLEGERGGDGFGVSNAMWGNGSQKLVALGAGKAGPNRTGRAYVYEWGDAGFERRFVIDSDETATAFAAMFVAFAGDMDGDDVSEVYFSDWQNGAKGANTGRIYIYSGASGEQLFTLTGEQAGDGFGTCTADVGDVDGDGVADLLVGAWQVREAAPSGGKCYLYSIAGSEVIATYTCNVSGETLGFDTTGVGDLDGDGGIDFLVTSGYSGVMGPRSGRAFIIAGPVLRAGAKAAQH